MKLPSLIRLGTLICILLVITVSSIYAQREFIDRGSRGTAVEIGYATTDDIEGIVGAVGFTSDRDLDFGFGVGKYSAGRSTDIYSFQLNTAYYVAKTYGESGRFFLSLDAAFMHEWYKYSDNYYNSNKSYSGIALGPTVTFGPRSDKAQLLIRGGAHYFDMANVDEDDHWIKSVGVALAFRRSGGAWLGLTGGYSNNDSQDTFSVALLIVAEKL